MVAKTSRFSKADVVSGEVLATPTLEQENARVRYRLFEYEHRVELHSVEGQPSALDANWPWVIYEPNENVPALTSRREGGLD